MTNFKKKTPTTTTTTTDHSLRSTMWHVKDELFLCSLGNTLRLEKLNILSSVLLVTKH